MTYSVFIKVHQKFLKENFDPKRAVKEKAYLYSELKHYGIAAKVNQSFFAKHKKFLSALTKTEVLNLVNNLWQKPSHEERSLATHILELHKDKLNATDMPLIEKLMRECRGWALLDNLIIPIMPTLLAKEKGLYVYLTKWIKDTDFWVRRSALLAQLLFFRKGVDGNKELFFKLAKSQFNESWIDEIYTDKLQNSRAKFFIRKAIGWTLREMARKDPKSVITFLTKNKKLMSGLSFREGSRRLPKINQ